MRNLSGRMKGGVGDDQSRETGGGIWEKVREKQLKRLRHGMLDVLASHVEGSPWRSGH